MKPDVHRPVALAIQVVQSAVHQLITNAVIAGRPRDMSQISDRIVGLPHPEVVGSYLGAGLGKQELLYNYNPARLALVVYPKDHAALGTR